MSLQVTEAVISKSNRKGSSRQKLSPIAFNLSSSSDEEEAYFPPKKAKRGKAKELTSTPPTTFSPAILNLRGSIGVPEIDPSKTTGSQLKPKRGRPRAHVSTVSRPSSPPSISASNSNPAVQDMLGRVNDIFSQIEKRLTQLVDVRASTAVHASPISQPPQQCDETPPKAVRFTNQVIESNIFF